MNAITLLVAGLVFMAISAFMTAASKDRFEAWISGAMFGAGLTMFVIPVVLYCMTGA